MTARVSQSGSRRLFAFLSFVTVSAIGGQFLLAGAAVFGAADSWGLHSGLGGAIGFVVLIMAGLSLASADLRPFRVMVLVLFAAYVVQILLVVVAQSGGLPMLGALHPLNGAVMAFIAVEIIRKAW